MRVRIWTTSVKLMLALGSPAWAQGESGDLLGGLPQDPAAPAATPSEDVPPPPPAAAPASEAPPPAEASPAEPPPSAASPAALPAVPEDPLLTRAARSLFKAAASAFQRGDFEAASDWFLTAYELKPHPDVLLNLALAETEAGHFARAANHWSEYLKTAPSAEQANAQQTLERVRGRVGVVRISAPQGARVQVDYKTLGLAPIVDGYFVSPGPHIVSAGSDHRAVTVGAGGSLEVDFLSPEQPSDSAPVADTATQYESLPDWFFDTPPAWATAGLGAAGLVVATYAGLNASRSFSAHDDAANQIRTQWELDNPGSGTPCGPPAFDPRYENACKVLAEHERDGKDWRTAAWISFGVGAASAAGTMLYYYLDREPTEAKDDASNDVQALLSPGFGGLGWKSAF